MIKTSKIAAFLNTGTSQSPTWSRIRKQGELKLKYEAGTSEDTYIDEDTPTTNVDSYAVSFDGELTCMTEDEIFSYLDGIRKDRATGGDCETDCLIVYMYDGNTENGYAAEKNRCSIQIGEFGGEGGGGKVTLSYTCTFNGDPIIGTVTIAEGELTFSEASA